MIFFTTAPHYDSCQFSVNQVVSLFTRLGFVIHPTKSILVPQQEIVFLGFVTFCPHDSVLDTTEKGNIEEVGEPTFNHSFSYNGLGATGD